MAQKVGIRAFTAISKLINGQGKRVRFKKRDQFFSFEGKNNLTFLRLIQSEGGLPQVKLKNVFYSLHLDYSCNYQKHALASRCKYVRIVKRRMGGRVRYFAQLVCEGAPFQDLAKVERHKEKMADLSNKESSLNYPQQDAAVAEKYQDVVCLDFGPKKVAVSTLNYGFERDISEGLVSKQREIRLLQRALDRSHRASNPGNFNSNGTMRKGKKVWTYSNRYLELQMQLADVYRKQAAHRKSIQGDFANDVIVLGNCIKVERVSYKGFQKIYGKAVGLNAPSNFQSMLSRKAENARGKVEQINTFDTKLSQTCICGNQQKKPLHQRTHHCTLCLFGTQGAPVSRDLFSAFLGIFTENREVKEGRSKIYSSTLNLDHARLAIKGHRILSSAGLKTEYQTQTSKESSSDGVEQSAVESSAEIGRSTFLEFEVSQGSSKSGSVWNQKNLHP